MYITLAWENSQNLAMLPLVSPPNDVWETSAEIPYWWRLTALIWVVLLIGWIKFPTRHDQSEALLSTQIWIVKCHKYGISTLVSQTSFCRETSGSVAKCQLFSRANVTPTYFRALYPIAIIKEFLPDQMNAWSTSQVERTQKMIIPKIMLTCHPSYSFCSNALVKE